MNRPSPVAFPNLDGLRFLAFLAVFVSHSMNLLGYASQHTGFNFARDYLLLNGDLGVNFFFVLSGFLIVFLLIKEREDTGGIHLGRFFVRRLLRIWPVYFCVLGLGLMVFPWFGASLPMGFPLGVATDRLNPWLYVAFAGNFDYLVNGITNLLIGILWSISVEEQFYLFCPLLVAVVSPRRMLPLFVGLVAIALTFRWTFSPMGGMVFKYHSLSCVLYLATGGTLAGLANQPACVAKIAGLPRSASVLGYFAGLGVLPLRRYPWTSPTVVQLLPVVIALFFAFVIAEQNFAKCSFYKIGRVRWLSTLGRRTYGMYCYHLMAVFVTMFVFHKLGLNVSNMDRFTYLAVIVTSLAATIAVAELSFRYFESFFLKLKVRFAVLPHG